MRAIVKAIRLSHATMRNVTRSFDLGQNPSRALAEHGEPIEGQLQQEAQ
jgi:hypothetical protein